MVSSKSNRALTTGRGSTSAPGRMEEASGAARLPGPAIDSGRAGFTIIELLSSMAILIFIVMMMTRMFAEATSIWSLGSRQITAASEGRAIMDFIVREMTQAIADTNVTFKLNSNADSVVYGVDSVYGAACDEVCFVAVVQSGHTTRLRTGTQYTYFVTNMRNATNNAVMADRYRLVRVRRTESMFSTPANILNSAYHKKDWWMRMEPDWNETGSLMPVETIAENVAAFEVWAYRIDGYDGSGKPKYKEEFDYDSSKWGNTLPLWVDLYLELLSEDDAARAADLADAIRNGAALPTALPEFLARNVKRYSTSVFFPNRERALAVIPKSEP